MIRFDNGGILIEHHSELPDFRNSKELFADFETTSRDKSIKSTNPHLDCWIAGLGVSVDNCKNAYYIPLEHQHGTMVDHNAVCDWWFDVLDTTKRWVNHNIKYDAHVSANCFGVVPDCELVCTLNRAKILDSERWSFDLGSLSKSWLKEDISKYEAALAPYKVRNKDYGAIPADICGEYCCQDVLTVRRLHRYIESQMFDTPVDAMEIKLTKRLFEMERVGLRVDESQIKSSELLCLHEMLELETRLAQAVGMEFRPHANDDCFDVLCNKYGLPVAGWTESGNPSFDQDALGQMALHPLAPVQVIEDIITYRKLNTFVNMFARPYQYLQVDGRLKPNYNQSVRTGRMSAKKPNSQQLNYKAKELILPDEGCELVSFDYSQIEFRLIVHYIQDQAAIAAYAENPDTDFHEWVAGICGVSRTPAKTLNFLMGYGGGRKLLVQNLSNTLELVADLKPKAIAMGGNVQQNFEKLAVARAEKVYDTYHETLPGLKRMTRRATKVCEGRGYVQNLFKRRRYLPKDRAYIAFQNLNQSSAADIIKFAMLDVMDFLESSGSGIKVLAQVHDDLLLQRPLDSDPNLILKVRELMEIPKVPLRIPLRVTVKSSAENWSKVQKSDRFSARF